MYARRPARGTTFALELPRRMIRLLIADDHAVVRTGLEQLVATFDDVELVGAAADGAGGRRALRSSRSPTSC